jgi:hypothetical protein
MIVQPRFLAYMVAVGIVGLSGCEGRQASSSGDTTREIEYVRKQTLPSDGSMLGRSKPIRSDSSVRATWEVQTELNAQTYFHFLKDQMGSQYQVTSELPSAITFVKHIDGDTYTVEVRGKPTSAKAFEIAFIAAPD